MISQYSLNFLLYSLYLLWRHFSSSEELRGASDLQPLMKLRPWTDPNEGLREGGGVPARAGRLLEALIILHPAS